MIKKSKAIKKIFDLIVEKSNRYCMKYAFDIMRFTEGG